MEAVNGFFPKASSGSSARWHRLGSPTGRPVYGGFFWINGDGALPIPKDAYYMAGAGGQYTVIIPSHDLVVVRLGHFRGDDVGSADLSKSLALLLDAVPVHR